VSYGVEVPDLRPADSHHSLERDVERAREIAERGLILRATVGSVVHGLANPSTDDRDEMGVCIEPPEYVLGFHRFEHFAYRTQPEGVPSGPGDLDLTVYGLRRYSELALKGSPTVLLPLFVDDEHVIVRTELGDELQALAPSFRSRTAGRAFLGYLEAQRKALTRERHGARTRELSAKHGYDTKYAMHALRIGYQGVELLTTGRITLPMPDPGRAALREVRSGELPLDEVLADLDQITAKLTDASELPELPVQPDIAAVERFVVSAYRRACDAGAYAA
jgi:predicted nucleotidyltransferase